MFLKTEILANIDDDILRVSNFMDDILKKLLKSMVTGVLLRSWPDQEGNKLGSTKGTRAISTTSRRELSSSFFFSPARQGAEENSRHSDRNIRLFPSWSC